MKELGIVRVSLHRDKSDRYLYIIYHPTRNKQRRRLATKLKVKCFIVLLRIERLFLWTDSIDAGV